MSMFPAETLLAYTAACLLVVVSPGPDNILAVSRGLSQGRAAAALTSIGAAWASCSTHWPPRWACRC
jgi:threonine/homoserine/homoserine lactone efflux protein